MAIGNVPFADAPVYDNSIKDRRLKSQLHNYFFVKTIDKVKPGGLVAFITSTGTLDAPTAEYVRNYLSNKADFIAAIRLPNNAFQKVAGTSVTTDIIFLRKLHANEISTNKDWVKSTPFKYGEKL